VFIKDISRNDIDTRGTGFQNLNDWMRSVEEPLITLGGFGGSGITWIDLVLGGVGLLASMGTFAVAKSAIVSLLYTTMDEEEASNLYQDLLGV
jgi:hypothetical protein